MKKLLTALMAAFPIALVVWAFYLVLSAPPEPAFDWRLHMTAADHDAVVALLNHLFTKAAYAITWAIQLGYLAWLGVKWRAQKRDAARTARNPR
jgi:hypothetical protein